MVVATSAPIRTDVPIIDLSCKRSIVSELLVKASEEHGFFKVVNHGVPKEVIDRMEEVAFNFFSKPSFEKKLAAPPNPLGYGCKNIGMKGDVGEVEYLLLSANPLSISQTSPSISNDPTTFNCVVNDYIEAVRNLACEILELMTEGLHVDDNNKYVLSNFIRDVDSDSLLRVNHYPPCKDILEASPSSPDHHTRIGFGEHSDPQILTILRSNDVGGLQILLENGIWVPVSPDPMAFCVNVGDTLQVLTNGRFKSVKHRVLASSNKSRMSTMYFAAPSLKTLISPLSNMVTPSKPCLYRPFTWSEYKKAMYSVRLSDNRLYPFTVQIEEDCPIQ